MVRGAYDLQQLRIQTGLRLVANFRAKLKDQSPPNEPAEDTPEDELSVEAQVLVRQLKETHRRLTDGVARNRTLPAQKGFEGDELISTFAELALVDEYLRLEQEEGRQFRLLEGVLEGIPIYDTYLKGVRGVGPAMAAVLVTRLDPHKARHVSSFWKFSGLDVAPDGRGRSRQKDHLVERAYIDKNGDEKVRMSVTFDPWLKTKLVGVLATSFLRSKSPWAEVYGHYKHRLETDPAREKVSSAEYSKRRKAGEDVKQLWTPKRIHAASCRYAVKCFLAELWTTWRKLENLPVTLPYNEARRGYGHGEDLPQGGWRNPEPPMAQAAE